jgi:hypothetical protein
VTPTVLAAISTGRSRPGATAIRLGQATTASAPRIGP